MGGGGSGVEIANDSTNQLEQPVVGYVRNMPHGKCPMTCKRVGGWAPTHLCTLLEERRDPGNRATDGPSSFILTLKENSAVNSHSYLPDGF